jgi:hypothetical protein
MHLAPNKPNLNEGSSPLHTAGRKLGHVEKSLLWTWLHEDPQCPSRMILDKAVQAQVPMPVSLRHLNRVRARWGLGRHRGRPRQGSAPLPVVCGQDPMPLSSRLSFVGVHLFVLWLEQQQALDPVVSGLLQAIQAYQQAHPDEEFALLHHCEQTLLRRFQALLLAPLLGIERLTEFDTHEHPLPTLIGRGYQSSTLNQFLGQLERVDAAKTLMPALRPAQASQYTYIDGHMVAYWARTPMHKGKITMLGRIMAGSQAVIAHNEVGHAVFVEYHPPDIPLSQLIVEYCQQVIQATGNSMFVIDRAVNSVALASAFAERGWGLLCMLDDNEHHGLESFEATGVGHLDDGTPVYRSEWQVPRPKDPRHFVIVDSPEGKTLVYWGTQAFQKALEPTEWPRVYRDRNEIQELNFKAMIDHGGLKVNYGRKLIVGPDRHQQRKRESLDQSLKGAHQRVEKKADGVQLQQDKVAESELKGHGKRLVQRQSTLAVLEKELKEAEHTQAKLTDQASALGEPGERADRDFRKQTMMTIRTLLLENLLHAFLAVVLGTMQSQISLDCMLRLLFERSGARLETCTEVIYWINTAGLSLSYRRLLAEMVAGLCVVGLRERGKPIRIDLKEIPP